jgi:hypothetical protein
MIRRIVSIAVLSLSLLGFVRPAHAGSYLDRAALLLEEAREEGDLLQPRTNDKELVRLIRAMAEVRAKMGRQMEVPAEVAKAHPHLLLVLENLTRAADAANDGNFRKFMEHLNTARDEEKNFRAIVAELGYRLPEIGKR